MRISDWSSDVCSSDLGKAAACRERRRHRAGMHRLFHRSRKRLQASFGWREARAGFGPGQGRGPDRSEEHTSELQSLMRISYAVFCLKKKNIQTYRTHNAKHTNTQYHPPSHIYT